MSDDHLEHLSVISWMDSDSLKYLRLMVLFKSVLRIHVLWVHKTVLPAAHTLLQINMGP